MKQTPTRGLSLIEPCNFEGLAKQFNWSSDDGAPARVESMEVAFIGELVFLC